MTNEPVWSEWIPNPGDGECPVPEFAEEYWIHLDNGEVYKESLGWDWRKTAGLAVTHYRYQVPADLAWLAENVSEWSEYRYWSAPDKERLGNEWRNTGSVLGWPHSMKPEGFEVYTKPQWLRARRDLGYEQDPVAAMQGEYQDDHPGGDPSMMSKYHKRIRSEWVDVYDILHAFEITNPGDQHAIKKMLQPGKRGYKDARQDREEAIASLVRANELESEGKGSA